MLTHALISFHISYYSKVLYYFYIKWLGHLYWPEYSTKWCFYLHEIVYLTKFIKTCYWIDFIYVNVVLKNFYRNKVNFFKPNIMVYANKSLIEIMRCTLFEGSLLNIVQLYDIIPNNVCKISISVNLRK